MSISETRADEILAENRKAIFNIGDAIKNIIGTRALIIDKIEYQMDVEGAKYIKEFSYYGVRFEDGKLGEIRIKELDFWKKIN